MQKHSEIISCLPYIKAYEDSRRIVTVPITITGEESINVTVQGIYQIICQATNSEGHSFSKRIPVLVY